jgi:hypothetical protein
LVTCLKFKTTSIVCYIKKKKKNQFRSKKSIVDGSSDSFLNWIFHNYKDLFFLPSIIVFTYLWQLDVRRHPWTLQIEFLRHFESWQFAVLGILIVRGRWPPIVWRIPPPLHRLLQNYIQVIKYRCVRRLRTW